MARGGVSGLGVAVAAAGAYVTYAAVRDVPLLEGARQLLRGQTPTPRVKTPGAWQSPASSGSSSAGAAAGAGSSSGGAALANAARRYLGYPYVWGGTFAQQGGGDCSGLVFRAFADVGVSAPRTSAAQSVWARVARVARADVAAGDLLWWPGHIAIAVDSARMIEAPTYGIPVRIVAIRSGPLCLRYRWGS